MSNTRLQSTRSLKPINSLVTCDLKVELQQEHDQPVSPSIKYQGKSRDHSRSRDSIVEEVRDLKKELLSSAKMVNVIDKRNADRLN